MLAAASLPTRCGHSLHCFDADSGPAPVSGAGPEIAFAYLWLGGRFLVGRIGVLVVIRRHQQQWKTIGIGSA